LRCGFKGDNGTARLVVLLVSAVVLMATFALWSMCAACTPRPVLQRTSLADWTVWVCACRHKHAQAVLGPRAKKVVGAKKQKRELLKSMSKKN
jgi:hypothetical protein